MGEYILLVDMLDFLSHILIYMFWAKAITGKYFLGALLFTNLIVCICYWVVSLPWRTRVRVCTCVHVRADMCVRVGCAHACACGYMCACACVWLYARMRVRVGICRRSAYIHVYMLVIMFFLTKQGKCNTWVPTERDRIYNACCYTSSLPYCVISFF